MLLNIILLLIIVFDIVVNINSCKKNKSNFEKRLPYTIETFVLLFIAPSIMMNYYLINDCKTENSLQMSLVYLVISGILSLFGDKKKSKKIKNLFMMVAINIFYIFIVSENFYLLVKSNDIFLVAFTVLTILLTFLVCISILDILIKNIVYGFYNNNKKYNHIITLMFYVIFIYFFTNISAFRYYDNLVSTLVPSSIQANNSVNNGNIEKDNNTSNKSDTYVTRKNTPQSMILVENSLLPIDDDISHDLKHDYTGYQVGNGVYWLLNDNDYKDIEFLNYLETVCKDNEYNPFRVTRLIFSDYLDTKVTTDFSSSVTFDTSNNLYIDYTQYENEDIDTYIKRMYYKIMRVFYSGDIDLTQVNIGKEDNQRYIFTVFFNEVTQTYDVFSLYFNFNSDDKFKSIHYDIVSISKNPISICSDYVDILPINQTDEAKEHYESYSINNYYYITFKYYG